MNGLPCREAAAVVIALFLPTSLLAVSGLSTPLPGGAERGFASPLPDVAETAPQATDPPARR